MGMSVMRDGKMHRCKLPVSWCRAALVLVPVLVLILLQTRSSRRVATVICEVAVVGVTSLSVTMMITAATMRASHCCQCLEEDTQSSKSRYGVAATTARTM